jgi:hypothetical protein
MTAASATLAVTFAASHAHQLHKTTTDDRN